MLTMVRRCQGGASRVSRSGEDHTQGEGEADGRRAHALKVAVSQYPVCARAGFYFLTYFNKSARLLVLLLLLRLACFLLLCAHRGAQRLQIAGTSGGEHIGGSGRPSLLLSFLRLIAPVHR